MNNLGLYDGATRYSVMCSILQAPDALGVVPFTQTEVVVKRKIPYFNLKVNTVNHSFFQIICLGALCQNVVLYNVYDDMKADTDHQFKFIFKQSISTFCSLIIVFPYQLCCIHVHNHKYLECFCLKKKLYLGVFLLLIRCNNMHLPNIHFYLDLTSLIAFTTVITFYDKFCSYVC